MPVSTAETDALSLSCQHLLHSLGTIPLRHEIPTRHRATRPSPRCGWRRRRSPCPNHLIPPRRRRVSLRSRCRRRPSLRLHTSNRPQSDETGHERDVLFSAVRDAVGGVIGGFEQRSFERGLFISGAAWADDGVYGGESAEVRRESGGGAGGERC